MAMPPADEIRPLRRVEYDRLVELGAFCNERVELLEGWLVEMSPIGPLHSATVQRLHTLLVSALGGRAMVFVQSPFAALDTSEPQPDVAVVPVGDYNRAHPSRAHVVIEVADRSLERDRVLKQRVYAMSGVPEYWIVNVRARRVEVHQNPLEEAYQFTRAVGAEAVLTLPGFPDVTLPVADILD